MPSQEKLRQLDDLSVSHEGAMTSALHAFLLDGSEPYGKMDHSA